jgi:hypothetical protein
MDNDLLNGILLSYSKILRELEDLKGEIKRITEKINNINLTMPTPVSLPPSNAIKKNKMTQKNKTKKVKTKRCKKGRTVLEMLEDEIE